MNKEYEIIRLKLADQKQPVQYFTPEFFETYLNYRKKAGEAGDYSSVALHEDVRKTDFYTKTSTAYCEFLELYHDRLPKFRIDFCESGPYYTVGKRLYDYFENIEYARNFAKHWAPTFGFPFYEVNRVA